MAECYIIGHVLSGTVMHTERYVSGRNWWNFSKGIQTGSDCTCEIGLLFVKIFFLYFFFLYHNTFNFLETLFDLLLSSHQLMNLIKGCVSSSAKDQHVALSALFGCTWCHRTFSVMKVKQLQLQIQLQVILLESWIHGNIIEDPRHINS